MTKEQHARLQAINNISLGAKPVGQRAHSTDYDLQMEQMVTITVYHEDNHFVDTLEREGNLVQFICTRYGCIPEDIAIAPQVYGLDRWL
jgi:hypothetical protein